MQIAYLDAGTGSILASAAVGGLAAVGVAARSVRARFSFRKNKDEAVSTPTADEESVSVDAAD